ncbi:MAG: DUF4416 family protein [Proteobacteria bacterium]|nr:DUF4416 family protein [Desulfobacteraceae bacterium]MBU3980797.1 DUF4416 family protein [Pseudomonadota bacterium]MBU4011881.1 DUF4416 family protein [Pseudomonadota bacterium]MBU4068092.1 DUF4416 family protein [Pseudomonadota bacterium]MBU4100215.1 DUF4416 family protein [Pseudomonadota bacterium]
MSIPQSPKPAKLVIGLFMKEKSLIVPVTTQLVEKIGSIDMVSSWLPFNYTSYYEPEMGSPLFRRVLAFKSLVKQSALPEIKIITNKIEKKYSKNNKRLVNIDPGYMLHERFVLATGKNYTHRIYIGMGIFADLTLIYQKGSFRKLPWTYPDYAEKNMLTYLEMVRNKYVVDLKMQTAI